MQTSEKELVREANETGFRPEIMEKVWHLMAILDGLTRILEKNASRVEKTNYRDELPLRGLLQCPKCHSSWTDSGSRGNGGTYFYYHCQNGCKERVKAEEANSVFSDYLSSFQVHPPIFTWRLWKTSSKQKREIGRKKSNGSRKL